MKIRKFNTDRMREHRIKHLPHYKVWYFDSWAITQMRAGILDEILKDRLAEFEYMMRRRHIWTKRKFRIQTFTEHDIDFNRHRFIIEERLL